MLVAGNTITPPLDERERERGVMSRGTEVVIHRTAWLGPEGIVCERVMMAGVS